MVDAIPRSSNQLDVVAQSRAALHQIIHGQDRRLIGVVGPCSIHDLKACLEYAEKFAKLSQELEDRLLLLMRVYFEKPRTTVGWKGLIMDPQLNGTCDIPSGLHIARSFLGEVLDLGIPTATELLDPITPQYLADSLSWAAIGARTSESQTHRQMASGLSMPVGFKNGTGGNTQIAIDAIRSSAHPHRFLGVTKQSVAAIVSTVGNKDCHLILRGGADGPSSWRGAGKRTKLRRLKLGGFALRPSQELVGLHRRPIFSMFDLKKFVFQGLVSYLSRFLFARPPVP